MPAKDLGAKHVCFKCGTKFYDLRKPVAVCPKCGADQRESPAQKSPSSERKARALRTVEPVVDEVEPVETDEDGEADEELDDDTEDVADDEG
jgi:uncharacterized protein (TIGR02300 family)